MTALDGNARNDMRAGMYDVRTPRTSPGIVARRQRYRRHVTRVWVTDILVISAAVALATSAAVLTPSTSSHAPLTYLAIAGIIVGAWLTVLTAFGAYQERIMGAGPSEYRRVLQASIATFGVLAIVFEVAQWPGLRMHVLIALPLGLVALLVGRWSWRKWLRTQRKRGRHAARTIVVGHLADVTYVLDQLLSNTDRYHVVGVVLDDEEKPGNTVFVGGRHYPTLPQASVAVASQQLQADSIIVASIPPEDPKFVRRLSWQLEGSAAELILSSRLADIAGPRVSLSPLEGLPLIHVSIPTFEGAAHTAKRAFDLVLGSIGCLVVGLMTPAIALAIRLDSKGPVFFRQQRVGRDGREFTMYKFRSMSDAAEQELEELLGANQGAGLLFKMKADPRVTRVGRVLRKYSLDELPQFFNVLKGDMSIAGPRPPLPSEVRNYEGKVFRRLYIKPGITGLWQVSGRSDLTWEESVTLDLRYVEDWSVALDLMIVWRTVKVMLRPSGAY